MSTDARTLAIKADAPLTTRDPVQPLFTHLFEDGWIELRAIHPRSRTATSNFFKPNDWQGIEQFLADYSGHDCYFGVAARRHDKGGGIDDLLSSRAVWADVDFKNTSEEEARARLAKFPYPPSFIVHSGGGWHCYWLLECPADLSSSEDCWEFSSRLKRLAKSLNADLAATDAPRILRVPGTCNRKPTYGKPRPVRLTVCEPERRYSLDAFPPEQDYLPKPKHQPARIESRDSDCYRVERARAYLAACPAPIESQGSDLYTYRICCKLIGQGERDFALTIEEALPLLCEWQPAFDERWFEQKLQNAEKYARNHEQNSNNNNENFFTTNFTDTAPHREPSNAGSSANLRERSLGDDLGQEDFMSENKNDSQHQEQGGQQPSEKERILKELVTLKIAGGSAIEYELKLKEGAKKLGVRKAILNAEVNEQYRLITGSEEAYFLPLVLAKEIMRKRPHLKYWAGRFYDWDETRYIEVKEGSLQNEVRRLIHSRKLADGSIVSIREWVSETINEIRQLTTISETRTVQLDWWLDGRFVAKGTSFIPCRNGIIEVPADPNQPVQLLPHSPNWFSMSKRGFDYRPDAQCPAWLKFLDEVMEGDPQRIAILQEIAGLCLTPHGFRDSFFVLSGGGGNGKNVYTSIVTRLVGEDNVSNLQLLKLGSQFGPATLFGKLLNVSNESEDIDSRAETELKAYVNGTREKVHADVKYEPPLEYVPTVRLMLLTNKRPQFQDTDAIDRRMIYVPFLVTIPESKKIQGLDEILWEEASGIFNWALQGRHRLMAQGYFTKSNAGEVAKEDYRDERNPVRQFAKAVIVEAGKEDAKVQIRKDHLYEYYRRWCKENGIRRSDVKTRFEFDAEIKRLHKNVKADAREGSRQGDRRPCWGGIGVPDLPEDIANDYATSNQEDWP